MPDFVRQDDETIEYLYVGWDKARNRASWFHWSPHLAIPLEDHQRYIREVTKLAHPSEEAKAYAHSLISGVVIGELVLPSKERELMVVFERGGGPDQATLAKLSQGVFHPIQGRAWCMPENPERYGVCLGKTWDIKSWMEWNTFQNLPVNPQPFLLNFQTLWYHDWGLHAGYYVDTKRYFIQFGLIP